MVVAEVEDLVLSHEVPDFGGVDEEIEDDGLFDVDKFLEIDLEVHLSNRLPHQEEVNEEEQDLEKVVEGLHGVEVEYVELVQVAEKVLEESFLEGEVVVHDWMEKTQKPERGFPHFFLQKVSLSLVLGVISELLEGTQNEVLDQVFANDWKNTVVPLVVVFLEKENEVFEALQKPRLDQVLGAEKLLSAAEIEALELEPV